ncbi:unnamed protein product [Cuscuta campestris]|uniref:Uncharacterized protein n=1 Tax=Cuscuta campestris TaxID=132261 RepID=A0A484NRX1_9ASTE|nr:unnamed protein product [Cuscuta campestris]
MSSLPAIGINVHVSIFVMVPFGVELMVLIISHVTLYHFDVLFPHRRLYNVLEIFHFDLKRLSMGFFVVLC